MPFHPSVYPLCSAISNELRDLRRQLERLAERLCLDEEFLLRHVESLQLFDALAQQSEESACLLDRLSGGMTSDEALVKVKLGVLQERLRAGLNAPVTQE
jgi:predicted nucleotidyltransferase